MWMTLQIKDTGAAARLQADPDVELIQWSEREGAKVRQVVREVWRDWSKSSELAGEAFDLHMAFMKRVGLLRE